MRSAMIGIARAIRSSARSGEADALTKSGAALKHYADAAAPLYRASTTARSSVSRCCRGSAVRASPSGMADTAISAAITAVPVAVSFRGQLRCEYRGNNERAAGFPIELNESGAGPPGALG